MSDPGLRLGVVERIIARKRHVPFGRLLINAGLIDPPDLRAALDEQRRVDTRLGDILVARGLIDEDDVLDALSIQNGLERADLSRDPPRADMALPLSAQICATFQVVPWRWLGDSLLVACTHPEDVTRAKARLGPIAPPMIPVLAAKAQIHSAISALHGAILAHRAVTRVPLAQSARLWSLRTGRRSLRAVALLLCLCVTLALAPVTTVGLLLAWGVLTLAMTSGLKAAAFVAELSARARPARPPPVGIPERLPRISVMVPLFREKEIAGALIRRLERLTYPKSLLNVVLVLEARDDMTRQTLAATRLPHWISVIEVPDDGTITTKPRALNYALDFCDGDIVGVWDAEDAPAPDQLQEVVARFSHAAPDVACLQGMLDYYNSRTNWIARCFAIEYATWWRVVMPGMARLGCVIPLGGTTLFFRRQVLEDLGGWDAHNVTEDADLGLRLARRGYRTELIPTVTMEEANCRAIPWIRQRSRWLKGFLITYLVHMRHPLALLRDLGLKRFLGVQVIFLATFSQFAALPFLWSFWLPFFDLPHPVQTLFGAGLMIWLGLLFFFAELMNIVIGMVAVSGPRHRHLMIWVITMPIYFTMGAFAAYKALFELVVTPFYWDKTSHGIAQADGD